MFYDKSNSIISKLQIQILLYIPVIKDLKGWECILKWHLKNGESSSKERSSKIGEMCIYSRGNLGMYISSMKKYQVIIKKVFG